MKSELEGFKTGSRDLELQVQADGARQLHARVGHDLGTGDRDRGLAAGRNGERHRRHGHREPAHRRAAAQRQKLPVSSSRLSPNVSAEFAGAGQAGDRQGGTRANQQLSISGQRREFNYYTLDGVDNTDVNFNTYIFLPSVDALEEFKVQTGVYSAEFGREASQVNVVTKSGIEQPARHGVRVPPRRCAGRAGRTRSPRRRPRPRRRRSNGISTATPRAARSGRTSCSSCRTSKATRIGNSSRRLTPCRSTAMRSGDFSELLASLGAINPQTGQRTGIIVDPTQCTVVGTTRTCAPFPGNIIPASRMNAISKKLLEFYPEPNNGTGATHQQLSLAAGSRDRQEPVHAADGLRPELDVGLDGPLQLRQGERDDAGAEAERHEAGHAGCIRSRSATPGRCRRRSSTNSGSATTTSSTRSDASWRSSATSIKELDIPGISLIPRRRPGGFRRSASPGFSGFGDSTEGPYTNRNKAFEFSDNVSWIRGRHSFKVGGGIRYDMYNQVGNQFARGNFQFQQHRHGYAVRRLLARLHAAGRSRRWRWR